MLKITERQHAALAAQSRETFCRSLKAELSKHPLVGPAARERPIEWFRFAAARAQHHGIDAEIDVAEFAAQLLHHGDALLDRADVRQALASDNDGWVKVRHIADFHLLVDDGA